MNRLQSDQIKRALISHGIDVKIFTLDDNQITINGGSQFINEHNQLNGNGKPIVDNVVISSGDVTFLHNKVHPPFTCNFEESKTSLYNTPIDDHKIEYSTKLGQTLTSFTGNEMIHFTRNAHDIVRFQQVAHPIVVFNLQVNNQNNIIVNMNDKKIEVLTMVRALGTELNNFLMTENDYFIFIENSWQKVGMKEICRRLHQLCETRLVLTKEIKSYLGTYHRSDFQSSIERECFRNVDTTLSKDIFPMSGSKVKNRKIESIIREEYILFSSGWTFDDALANDRRESLNKFIYKLFPIFEERRVMLKYCASLLHGHRTEKKFVILTDERGGNNGKSTWVNFLSGFFGEMTYNNTRLFLNTTIQDKNGQDAILYKIHNKRLLIGSEFKDGMKLDVSLMKKLTGVDPITGRHFGKQEDFSFMSQAGVILVYNDGDAPKEDWGDDAYQSRKLVFKMKSKFIKGLKQDDPSTFTFRSTLITKKRELYSAFLKLLLDIDIDWDEKDELLSKDFSSLHIDIENFLDDVLVIGNGFVELQRLFKQSTLKCKSKEFLAIAKEILIAKGGVYLKKYSPIVDGKRKQYYNIVNGFMVKYKI